MNEGLRDDFSRRNFLRLAAAAPVGAVAGAAMLPIESEAMNQVERVTGVQTGNAAVASERAAQCQGKTDDQCMEDYFHSPAYVTRAVVDAPINEEIICRTTPALFMDLIGGIPEFTANPSPKAAAKLVQTPLHNALLGTPARKTSRRELIMGAATSLIFGALHNITPNGFDTKTIPAAQVVAGGTFWVLQRNFGMAANIAAHAATNGIIISRTYK